jgi:predicted NBD/HSP70 family sugar kinase
LTSILKYVRDHGSSSRHDIAQGCGLGISTMTDLIGELRSRRLVKELDPIRRPAAGRPTRPIALDGEPWCALGIQIDVDQVQFSAATIGGREVWHKAMPINLREIGAEGHTKIRDVLGQQLAKLPVDKELLAVEVGVPGYVARDRGTVSWSAALGWHDFPLSRVVTDALNDLDLGGIHVGVSNDCHLAGLHASRVELHLPTDTVAIYLGGIRSVGSSVVIAGEIFRGANGGAGDLGHKNVDLAGIRCWCGRDGCLDTLVGLRYLLANGGLFDMDEAAALVDASPRDAGQLVLNAAVTGDDRVLEALRVAGDALGRALDDLIGLLNPHTVILGGYLGPLSPYLMPNIEARLVLRTAIAAFASTEIVALDTIVPRVVRGGALAARDACLNDPLHLTRVIR